MNKRLRKKKHLGEFRQFGFSLDCRFRRADVSLEMFDQFTDEFIVEAIESRSLLFGGGGSPERGWSGIVSRNHRYDSTSESDRSALSAWLGSRPEVALSRVSALWDIWHRTDPFEALNAEPSAPSNRRPAPGAEVEPSAGGG